MRKNKTGTITQTLPSILELLALNQEA